MKVSMKTIALSGDWIKGGVLVATEIEGVFRLQLPTQQKETPTVGDLQGFTPEMIAEIKKAKGATDG